MTDASNILRVTSDRKSAEEWELVLLAQRLSPALRQNPDGAIVLSVPEKEVDRARAALCAYETENPPQLHEKSQPLGSINAFAGGVAAGILVVVFYAVVVVSNPAMTWFERGSADTDKILDGELWRTVTALTLHADVAHAVSNAVSLALFLAAVATILGTGLTCFLVLLAGAVGNLANALLHGSAHISVGASTAVFGAVGILGGLGMARPRTGPVTRRRAWLPFAAVLALLGMLGSGGERVDIWAHLLGLMVGAPLGLLLAPVGLRPPSFFTQWIFATGAMGVLVAGWWLALS